jgi:hypothetical protein
VLNTKQSINHVYINIKKMQNDENGEPKRIRKDTFNLEHGTFKIHAFLGLKNSLTPPLYNDVPVPSQESELSCICVLGSIDLAHFYYVSIEYWNCSWSK